MSTTKTTITSALASIALHDAYTDFTLSRQAMNCSPFTMHFYRFTEGAFVTWIAGQGITSPDEVTARYVRRPEEAKRKAASLLHLPYKPR